MQNGGSRPQSSSSAALASAPRKRKFKFLVLGAAAAGKTSLLRRYFYHQFDYERRPTLGSDFFVGKVPYRDDADITVQVQFWDTPGTLSKIGKKPKGHHYSASLSGAFFQHADAIMLLYDMTSSTSFTRLLKWYADLMDLFSKTGSKRLPILIVANKLDLFQENTPGARHPPRRVPQRDVLGLPKDYCGNDFQYEYSVCTISDNINNIQVGNGNQSGLAPNTQNKGSEGVSKPSNRKDKFSSRRRSEISSYLVNRENWTTDGSYLESLLHSEEKSHPDREMVLLWCMRNELALHEVSAATGEGVDEAMEAMVTLALEASSSQDERAAAIMDRSGAHDDGIKANINRRSNQELDLHKRYAPKDETCCWWFSPPALFRNCPRARDAYSSKE